MNPFLNTAEKAALQAGKIIEQGMRRPYEIKIFKKSNGSYATNIDLACEKTIIDILSRAYPHHSILSEECGMIERGTEHCWIIDPLDGTTNFIHGFPHFAVSIALLADKRLEAGVIYDPSRNELFSASKGSGATLNQRKIRVSSNTSLSEALVAIGLSLQYANHSHTAKPSMPSIIARESASMRRSGSIALDLAYVACARLDVLWESRLQKWDIAAGALLVMEAGGVASGHLYQDNFLDSGDLVAANVDLAGKLQARYLDIH